MPSKSTQKKSGWKTVQSKTRMKQRTRLALIVLGLVVGLLILSWLVKFTQNLFSPQTNQYHKNYLWNGEFNLNLVVKSKNISLLTYKPKENSVVIVNIPDNTFLEVPDGFGKWQLGSVYGLGGNKLLAETLKFFLAVPIDGFLDFSDLNPKSTSEIVTQLRQNPISGFELLSGLKTNLTMWELIKLKLGISGVRFDKVEELDLGKLNVLDKENLSDNTPILTSDPVKLDSVLISLTDPAVSSERKSIAMFNATRVPQLANKWARLITNLGGNVIITANAASELEQTEMAGESSATLRRLQQVFAIGCKGAAKCVKVNSAGNQAPARAQINLFLGADLIR